MFLETERLRIRTLVPSDWPAMRRIFDDFSRSPWAGYDRPLPTEESAVRALVEQFAAGGLFYAVFRKGEDTMIGYVCFHDQPEGYDLGYCFRSDFHHQGYAAESIRALLWQLRESRGVTRFTAGTALDNTPSCRLLERLGFVCVSRETVSFDGGDGFPGGNFVLDAGHMEM